jgi:prepilin-type N-terminal cleavage/methylation domain-containing protein
MENKGFTLIELMIAMFVGLLIMVAVYASMEMAMHSSASVGRKVVTQQDTRAVMDLMVSEIRQASLNFTDSNTLWNNVCGGGANVLLKGIQLANAANIVILADLNGNGIIGEANEVISYSYDNAANTISRTTGCNGVPEAILGGGANISTRVVNSTAIPAVPLFQYFDAVGNPITDANLIAAPAVWIPQIRRVRINIIAETQNLDDLMQQRKRMTYTTEVLVRNHVLSR